MMFRIAWKSKITGATGHGNWFPKDQLTILNAWIEKMEEEYPELDHWVEIKPCENS